ncbi:MAG: alkaline phosphatase family protein [Planctomycetes bacterium]|nr:alkaline phosphatase family protein [Planctomycetota bacterium]
MRSARLCAKSSLAVGLLALALGASAPARAGDTPAPQYKLAVVIVIDQFRADYLTRFGDLFGPGGFKLLTERGAWFTNCHFEHAVTKTGPGHASIATGANPAVHGIVGNDWLESADGKQVVRRCIADPTAKAVGLSASPGGVGASAKRLMADTLADQLKKASPESRVLCCSLKDTAANLLAGNSADTVLWWHTASGLMITSDSYAASLPDWVQTFNDDRVVDRFLGRPWTRLASPAEYDKRCRSDDFQYEQGTRYTGTNAFPHRTGLSDASQANAAYYRAVFFSPFGNDVLLELARRGVEAMQLGRRGVTDLLLVSLSSNDLVGHAYGPFSHEVMDVTLRTDHQLAEFLKFLDQRVGLDRCVIALTGDHGAGMVPEYAIEKYGRGGRLDAITIRAGAEAVFSKTFGKLAAGQEYVARVVMPWLYFNTAVLKQQGVSPEKLRVALKDVVAAEPGLAGAFVVEDIQSGHGVNVPPALAKRIERSYYPGRAGQVYLHVTEHWQGRGPATGHGSAYPYDTHVPLLLFGRGIKPGKHDQPVAPTDIAPTLAHLLKIAPPSKATGRVLTRALATNPKTPSSARKTQP